MPVSDEYAARTPCRNHTLINTKPLRGSVSRCFYSECENGKGGCRFSHTIFNVNRVRKLGSRDGRRSYVVGLHYGHGFERYGAYEWADSGWEVTMPDESGPRRKFMFAGSWLHNLPKALLVEESRAGLRKEGDAPAKYEKIQSLCRAHHERNKCRRRDCKFDHDLVDSARIEKLARWMPCDPHDTKDYDALTVEYRVVEGQTTWKIILKEAAFARLEAADPFAQRIPSRPYSYESAELLDAVRHMEQVVGLVNSN